MGPRLDAHGRQVGDKPRTGSESQQMVERLRRTREQPTAPLDVSSYPVAVDVDGNPLDPTTELQYRLPRANEPSTADSIFGVPSGHNERFRRVTVQEQLEVLYRSGFRGRAVFTLLPGQHPLAEGEREKAKSRTEQYPPTQCRICTAIIAGTERMRGYTLLELRHASQNGCSTCTFLYNGITHYAGLLELKYEDWESVVQQEKTTEDTKLLADAIKILVTFGMDGEEVSNLAFNCKGTGGCDSAGLRMKSAKQTDISQDGLFPGKNPIKSRSY